jgi:hypothetical protein
MVFPSNITPKIRCVTCTMLLSSNMNELPEKRNCLLHLRFRKNIKTFDEFISAKYRRFFFKEKKTRYQQIRYLMFSLSYNSGNWSYLIRNSIISFFLKNSFYRGRSFYLNRVNKVTCKYRIINLYFSWYIVHICVLIDYLLFYVPLNNFSLRPKKRICLLQVTWPALNLSIDLPTWGKFDRPPFSFGTIWVWIIEQCQPLCCKHIEKLYPSKFSFKTLFDIKYLEKQKLIPTYWPYLKIWDNLKWTYEDVIIAGEGLQNLGLQNLGLRSA